MAQSWKCPECGLVNFASEANCKRCSANAVNVPAQSPPLGIVLEDGYVLPPPPTLDGIWRDKSTLVITKDACLPDRCIKCNGPANGLRLKRKLAWHTPVLYLAIFLAVLVYAVLAAVLSKRAIVYLGLCREHFERRRKQIAIGWLFLAVGFIGGVMALINDYPVFGLIGLLLFFSSVFWLVFVTRTVIVKKIDDQLVWLNGINPNYLAEFPPWHRQA
jgi:hypothetical protein